YREDSVLVRPHAPRQAADRLQPRVLQPDPGHLLLPAGRHVVGPPVLQDPLRLLQLLARLPADGQVRGRQRAPGEPVAGQEGPHVRGPVAPRRAADRRGGVGAGRPARRDLGLPLPHHRLHDVPLLRNGTQRLRPVALHPAGGRQPLPAHTHSLAPLSI
ncbi:uncharacterized protein ACA1_298420, partial [Acanthamoeba castellanii str. Neff]